ncbi:MAG: metallophosphoesterase family protein [Muribaculaceae bacterium]
MRNISIRLFSILLIISTAAPAWSQLKFNADGTFKIVQFTDIHWRPGDQNSEIAAENIANTLDAEKPDLVVITGDIIYGTPAKTCLDRTLKPIIDRKVPFAVTFGNHDAESDWTPKQIHDYLCTLPGNLTSTVDGVTGVTNYILSIESSHSAKEAAVLYMLDSHQYSQQKDLTDGYDWIKYDQIEWYRTQSAKHTAANGSSPLPSLAFFHIPVPEYAEAAANPATLLIGTRKEAPCCPKINTGLFSAMLLNRDVMAMFVGHDHVNDYICNWKGMALAYGRFSGGHTEYHDIQGDNGARVIVLTEGARQFNTWIRLRLGNKVINEVKYPDDFRRGE